MQAAIAEVWGSQQLGNFTSACPIATVSAAVNRAFGQQREGVRGMVLKKTQERSARRKRGSFKSSLAAGFLMRVATRRA